MRPITKVALAFLVLFLVFFCYVIVQGLNQFDTAARAAKSQHDVALASLIRDACLSYITEYGRLPPDADNQKLTAALLGDNSRHIAFLSLRKSQLNDNNEVVDRWGTPLKITFQGNTGIQITSAGPDQAFGTPDDIVFNNPDTETNH